MNWMNVGAVAMVLGAFSLSGCLGGGGSSAGDIQASFTVEQTGDGIFLFDASNSTGKIVEYLWNFGDGTLVTGNNKRVEMEYTITDAAPWVSLVVVGSDGKKSTIFKQVTLGSGQNAAPELHDVPTPRWVRPGKDVVLDATGAEDHDGDGYTVEWFFGPYIDPAPPEAALDTGILEQDQSFDQVFNTPGVYLIHCHPHPWMTGRIVVADGANTTGNATLDISNFAFNGGEDLVVAPGTNLNVRNLDPVGHTATGYFAAAGATKREETEKTLRLSGLAEGEYQAHVILDDQKPGFPGLRSWGVKVSADAPEIAFNETVASGTLYTSADNAVDTAFPSMLLFAANITAQLDYAPAPGVGAEVEFCILNASGSCVQGPSDNCDGSACTVSRSLQPGDYSFHLDLTDGAVTEWSISVKRFVYYAAPDFGTFPPPGEDPHAGH